MDAARSVPSRSEKPLTLWLCRISGEEPAIPLGTLQDFRSRQLWRSGERHERRFQSRENSDVAAGPAGAVRAEVYVLACASARSGRFCFLARGRGQPPGNVVVQVGGDPFMQAVGEQAWRLVNFPAGDFAHATGSSMM